VSTWRIDGVLGPAVSEPAGNPPSEPPYQFVAKLAISDLDAMMGFLGTEEGQQFVASWSVFVEPTAIFTTGSEV